MRSLLADLIRLFAVVVAILAISMLAKLIEESQTEEVVHECTMTGSDYRHAHDL